MSKKARPFGKCRLAVSNKPLPYTWLPNVVAALPEITPDSITSRTLLKQEGLRVVLFAFDAGQELSEHTSAYPAIIHILQGKATLTLSDDIQQAQAQTWVYMQANLPHSVEAISPLIMLLLLLG